MAEVAQDLIANMLTMNLNLDLLMTTTKHNYAYSTKKEYVEVERDADMLMEKKIYDRKDNLIDIKCLNLLQMIFLNKK